MLTPSPLSPSQGAVSPQWGASASIPPRALWMCVHTSPRGEALSRHPPCGTAALLTEASELSASSPEGPPLPTPRPPPPRGGAHAPVLGAPPRPPLPQCPLPPPTGGPPRIVGAAQALGPEIGAVLANC